MACAPAPGDSLRALTSLRFFAALMVFIHHTPATAGWSQTFAIAWNGVAFFFMLSGFILTYAYRERWGGKLTYASLRAFYSARFARIYPLYIVTLSLTLALLLALHRPLPAVLPLTLSAQIVMLQSWIPDVRVYQGLNSPEWSLSVEAFFYALFPFVLVGAERVFRAAPAAAIVAVGVTLWAVWGWTVHGMDGLWINWALYVFPPARAIDFVAGMLVALVLFKRRPGAYRWATLSEAAAIVAVFAGLGVTPLFPKSERYSFVLMPCFAALIYLFARRRGDISTLLCAPLAVRLGQISFALYLVQCPVLIIAQACGVWRHAWGFAAALAATIGAAVLLFEAVEVPLRAYVLRVMRANAGDGARLVYEVKPVGSADRSTA